MNIKMLEYGIVLIFSKILKNNMVNVEVHEETHKKLKILAFRNGRAIKDLVNEVLDSYVREVEATGVKIE